MNGENAASGRYKLLVVEDDGVIAEEIGRAFV